jgi:hypothetical protein
MRVIAAPYRAAIVRYLIFRYLTKQNLIDDTEAGFAHALAAEQGL